MKYLILLILLLSGCATLTDCIGIEHLPGSMHFYEVCMQGEDKKCFDHIDYDTEKEVKLPEEVEREYEETFKTPGDTVTRIRRKKL